MFDGVVGTYDPLNRLITLGLVGVWRSACAHECAQGGVVIDLCCGTGDLSLQISKRSNPGTLVVGLDFSEGMLTRALRKSAVVRARRGAVGFVLADASYLPLRDGCADRIGISFSFRNLTYRNPRGEAALGEALRILSHGGRFACVETSQPEGRLVRALYHLYLDRVVPALGGLVSGQKGAYRYLGVSARNFPAAEEVAEVFRGAGFRKVSYRRLAPRVVTLHVALK